MIDEMSQNSLVGAASALQACRLASKRRDETKDRGQFFTPSAVARFMASLLRTPGHSTVVLDPGAGTGILSAAVCERFLALRTPRKLHFQLYENDRSLVPVLGQALDRCRSTLRDAGHDMTYEVMNQDFILSLARPASLFARPQSPRIFDVAIMNPPYFKLSKGSAHARVMAGVVHGQPNIYALFMALASDLVRPGGQLVAITPRSFCNGPYFRAFRRWFFARMSLDMVHLYASRRDTFRESSVLQESVISAWTKGPQVPKVTVSTSHGQNVEGASVIDLPSALVLDDTAGDMILRIPESPAAVRIVRIVESWPCRFKDLGLRVSTGPVVAFRATQFLRRSLDGPNTAPFYSVHNVRPFETTWPVEKGRKPTAFAVRAESQVLLLPTRNYVLLRRFTAKEEHRRLVASPLLREHVVRPFVALENHLNYVDHQRRELTKTEAAGLTALFNSALLDRYFRTISGSTQVNAAEIRAMPLPPLSTIARIGRKTGALQAADRGVIENIILDELSIDDQIKRELLAGAR